jgi:hypothetical protein
MQTVARNFYSDGTSVQLKQTQTNRQGPAIIKSNVINANPIYFSSSEGVQEPKFYL